MNLDLCFITYFFEKLVYAFFVVIVNEVVEQLKRRVAGLTKEFEELKSYKKEIDRFKTMQKLVKEGFD